MEPAAVNILYPVFAMFALSAFCLFRLARLRFMAVRHGEIDPKFFRLYRDGDEPANLRVHARHLTNLFEAPVLFYVIIIIAFVTRQTGVLPLVLAWAYVILRYIHSYVHLTSNRVMTRFRVFAVSWLVLVVLWLVVFAGMSIR
jgi:hypothetical protein